MPGLTAYRDSLYSNTTATLDKLRDHSGKITLNADDLFNFTRPIATI